MRVPIGIVAVFGATLLIACARVQVPEPGTGPYIHTIDVSGEWEFEEEGAAQRLVLDKDGNGTYAWQNGRINTQSITDRRWQGLWYQEGNDREGGFELLISPDGKEAKGTWWYTRIGTRVISERAQGGNFRLIRLRSGDVRADR